MYQLLVAGVGGGGVQYVGVVVCQRKCRLQLTTKLGEIGEYSTYSTTNLSIDIVGNRLSSGKQKWPYRLSLSSSSFLTD